MLTISAPASASAADLLLELRSDHPELFVVPEVPQWPDNLPPEWKTPDEARCFREFEGDMGAGVWLPRELERIIELRLLELEQYPVRAQGVLDALVPRVVEAVADKVATAPAPGYRLSTVVMWTALGVLAGAAATATVVVVAQ